MLVLCVFFFFARSVHFVKNLIRKEKAIQMHDLCKEFVRNGHTVLVAVPTQARSARNSIELLDGVQILRVRTPRIKDIGLFRRAFAESILPWLLLIAIRRTEWGLSRWDGVIWYSPTIFLGPLVARIKKSSSCKSYLILRDLFTDWMVALGLMRRGIGYYFLKLVERQQYAVADTIGVKTQAKLDLAGLQNHLTRS